MTGIQLWVNGEEICLDEWGGTPLLWALQIKLGCFEGLIPCGIDQCGECQVLVDGRPLRACKTPLSRVAGKKIALP